MQALFCYRLSKEAGMAHNTETGEPSECYISLSFKDDNENIIDIPEDVYRKEHAKLVSYIAWQSGLEKSWIEPIGIDEYKENQEE